MSAGQFPVRDGFGWRLLVVDADRDTVDYVLGNLQRYEREVAAAQVARTGAEAISLAREFRPNILLIDPDLPDLDGFVVIESIVRDTQCVAVIMGQLQDPEDFMRAMDCGARGYLAKPLTALKTMPRSYGCCVGAEAFVFELLAPALLRSSDGGLAQGQ